MNRPKVIIIANHRPLDNDSRIRQRMASVESKAERLASRFPGLDVPAIQKGVHRNMAKLLLTLDGRYVDLLDLMNFIKNDFQRPTLTPENVEKSYSLSNNITLNGIYLYQYLSEQGYDPLIVQNYALTDLPDMLEQKPLAVCISTNFIFWDDVRDMAARIKEYDPEIPVIAGGMLVKRLLDPGENLDPRSLNSLSRFFGKVDLFVIEAQGEQTLLKVLATLEEGGDLAKVPNLGLFDKKGNIHFTPRQKEDLPMDQTAIAWDKTPRQYLRKTLAVNTSRGCYFRCRFCTFHWLFPQVQYKSLEVLKQELRSIDSLGFVEHVRFTDDNFTARKERLKQVLQIMIQGKFGFTWSSYARASSLTPQLVRLMKKAGCEFVYMGIESGSQRVLDNMDKKQTREQAIKAIKMLNDYGIYCRGSFIVGYPGETRETFLETVDLINKSGLPYYMPYLYSHSKRSLVDRERDRYGLKGIGVAWTQDTMDAVEASECIAQMTRMIPRSYNDGQTYIEEIYNLLLGKGYSADQILELFRLKRELHLATEKFSATRPFAPRVEQILRKLEALVK